VIAGNAMSRRAAYMYGNLLPRGTDGGVDAGLGKTTSIGAITLLVPADFATATSQKLNYCPRIAPPSSAGSLANPSAKPTDQDGV
jgi:hypothetical protein